MPLYDLECVGCGHVDSDVLCVCSLKAGEPTERLHTERTEEGLLVETKVVCPKCGTYSWARVKAMHLNARCDRAWTASCQFSKKG
jgi:hypothetical protein